LNRFDRRRWSSIARQLALFPMMVFAVWIEHALDVPRDIP